MLNSAGTLYNVLYIMVLQQTQKMCPPAGPTPETISDFWQMIWDVRPAVIVMLTKVDENGKVRPEKLQKFLYCGCTMHMMLFNCGRVRFSYFKAD